MNDPVLIAFTASRTSRGKTVWTRIGCAYPHEQGNGLTVLLGGISLEGRVILLEPDTNDFDRMLGKSARKQYSKTQRDSADSRRQK